MMTLPSKSSMDGAMGKVKNHFHDEICNQDDDGVYGCASCNQPIVRGRLCDDCLGKARKTSIERLPNMLEENRKYMKR